MACKKKERKRTKMANGTHRSNSIKNVNRCNLRSTNAIVSLSPDDINVDSICLLCYSLHYKCTKEWIEVGEQSAGGANWPGIHTISVKFKLNAAFLSLSFSSNLFIAVPPLPGIYETNSLQLAEHFHLARLPTITRLRHLINIIR